MKRAALPLLAGTALLLASTPLVARQAPAQYRVSGRTAVEHIAGHVGDQAGAAVWLSGGRDWSYTPASGEKYSLSQKDKQFVPHLLIVPLGAKVDFPNHDPIFHDVFARTPRAFDLGLYESGQSKPFTFTTAGDWHVFCNIHPGMSAVVLVVPSRWFAISDVAGQFTIDNVPAGDYQLHVYYEQADPATFPALARHIAVNADTLLPDVLKVVETNVAPTHKNKYGVDYDAGKDYGGGGRRP